jgi:type IV secretory pathway TrbF-like protein
MTDQQGSSRFQVLLESALQAYEKKAGVTLANLGDSLVFQLQRCHSIDHITTLLQDKAQDIDDLRQRDRIFKSIKATVSILTPISAVASVANDATLVRQKVLNAYLAFLTVFTDITTTYESDKFYSRHPTERVCHS